MKRMKALKPPNLEYHSNAVLHRAQTPLKAHTSMAARVRFWVRLSPSSGIRSGGPPTMNRRVEDPSLMMSPTLHWPRHTASAYGYTL